jgi:peptidoglycan hydrolase CwlO-like protein
MEINRTEIETKLGCLVHTVSVKNREIKRQQEEVAVLQKEVNELNQQLCELDNAG